MNKQSLQEAFKAMELLNEETFDLDDTNVYDDLQDFVINDNDNEISIIDMNAETQEDLLDDYVGQVILDCCVCHSKLYKDKEEIVIDDETQCANIDEECPYCSSMDGFKIIGEVAPYSETEVEVEVEEKDEDEIDDDVEKIETEEEKEIVEESLKSKKLNESQLKFVDNRKNAIVKGEDDYGFDEYDYEEDEDESLNEKLEDVLSPKAYSNYKKIVKNDKDLSSFFNFLKRNNINPFYNKAELNDVLENPEKYKGGETGWTIDLLNNYNESLNEDLTIIANIDTYEPWGGAETTYHEIENAGMLADFEALMEELYPNGIEMGKLNDLLWFKSEEILGMLGLWEPDPDDDGDQYDECMKTEGCKSDNEDEIDEACADDEINESIENIDIETEHEKIKVKTEEKDDHDNEMIVPVETETEDEIEAEQVEETSEDEPEDEEMVDVDFDEFDEETFDNIGESYLKKVYENVDSYKTSEVKLSKDNKIVIEGLIKFNSGNVKKTSFIFESKDMTKAGKLRFIGENCQISRGKKSFTLTGNLTDKKFISESLNYNYKTKNGEGKSTRVYGTQRIK